MANINIRVDDTLKQQSETLFEELGLNMTAAITAFLKQSVRLGGLPFTPRIHTRDAWVDYVDRALDEADEEARNPGPRITHEELMRKARSLVNELSSELQ